MQVSSGGKPIVGYQMQPGDVPAGVPEHFRHGAHLHPIYSPSGKLVTGNHPPDHRWHRGIWFAWTHTEFESRAPDFWNMGKEKDGKLTGEVRFERLCNHWQGPVEAGFQSEHRLIDHTSGTKKDALHETWNVDIYRPLRGANPAFAFDLVSTQQCAGDSPVKLPKYHYGGLGVRGNALWDPADKVTMLTSNGDDRLKGDGTKAKWVYLGGEVDGTPTGLTVLIHPDNFRFPQPFRYWYDEWYPMKATWAGMSRAADAFVIRQDIAPLKVGATYQLSFKVRGRGIQNGAATVAFLGANENKPTKFAASPTGRGAKVVKDETKEEVTETEKFTSAKSWTPVTKTFQVRFKDRNIKKIDNTTLAILEFKFNLPQYLGECDICDVQLVEKTK